MLSFGQCTEGMRQVMFCVFKQLDMQVCGRGQESENQACHAMDTVIGSLTALFYPVFPPYTHWGPRATSYFFCPRSMHTCCFKKAQRNSGWWSGQHRCQQELACVFWGTTRLVGEVWAVILTGLCPLVGMEWSGKSRPPRDKHPRDGPHSHGSSNT